MKPDGDLPAVGARGGMLGVRVPPDEHPDVVADGNGCVGPGGGGMSVSPRLTDISVTRVPKRLRNLVPGARGKDSDRVFRLGEATFALAEVSPALTLRPDDGHAPRHGVIEPSDCVRVEQFQTDLAATQSDWVIDEVG